MRAISGGRFLSKEVYTLARTRGVIRGDDKDIRGESRDMGRGGQERGGKVGLSLPLFSFFLLE